MTDYAKIIKNRVLQCLNGATAIVTSSYERYLKKQLPKEIDDPVQEAEDFKKFHDAGKSATSHLESLIKLLNATDDPKERERKLAREEEEQKRQEKIRAIEEARAEMKEHDNG